MSKVTAQEQLEATEQLRAMLPAGTMVYTVLEHVTSSGMTRWIKPLAIVDGELMDLSWWVRRANGENIHPKYYGVRMGGCGMDMGFALVHNLSYKLHNDGYALKTKWL